jgi:predicted O-linked N-acetylglucosamine transferase (SPINDLY family)
MTDYMASMGDFIDPSLSPYEQILLIQSSDNMQWRVSVLLQLVARLQSQLHRLTPHEALVLIKALIVEREELLAHEILVRYLKGEFSLPSAEVTIEFSKFCRSLEDQETNFNLLADALAKFTEHSDQRILLLESVHSLLEHQDYPAALEVLYQILAASPMDPVVHNLAIQIFNRMNLPEDCRIHEEFLVKQGYEMGPERISMAYWAASRAGTLERQEELRLRYLKMTREHLDAATTAAFCSLIATDDPEFLLRVQRSFANHVIPRRSSNIVQHQKSVRYFDTEKIRVAYVSPDFREHAVSYLIADLIGTHSRAKMEIYGFGTLPSDETEIGTLIRENFDHFSDVSNLRTPDIAAIVKSIKPHIIVDLCGFTKGFRPGLFEKFQSSIVINYLGYPSTLGSPHYDYILGDQIVTPEGSDDFYSEKIIRLPCCYQANSPSRRITHVERRQTNLPDDHFVFCSFNGRQKLNIDTLNQWKKILENCSDSVLWLLDYKDSNSDILRFLGDALSPRVIFAPQEHNAIHLGRLHHANLILDSFPYGAHTTASDAIYCGVPVLTKYGRSFQSRVAYSIMSHAGIDSLAVENWENYIDLAISEYQSYSPKIRPYSDLLLDFSRKNHPYNIKHTAECIDKTFEDIVLRHRG